MSFPPDGIIGEQMASRQQEIREGIALLIPTDCDKCYLDGNREVRSGCDDLEEPGSPCLLQLFLAKEYLTYLHSQGAVLKVGEIREIIRGAADPEAYIADGLGVSWERSAPYFRQFKEAGYTLTEPLIEPPPEAT